MTNSEIVAAIRAHCMAKEGAMEERPWDHFGWKVGGKLFAVGGEDSAVLTVKSTLEKQAALVQHPAIEKAAYVGRYGWVTITVTDEETLELTMDLIDESYDAVCRKGRKARSQR